MREIVVVGARALVRAAFVSLLSSIGFESIKEVEDLDQARAVKDKLGPESLIICLMPGAKEIADALNEIRTWNPVLKTVFVVATLDFDTMCACFAGGASGFLLETISRDALRESLNLVYAGEKVFPSDVASLFSKLTAKDPKSVLSSVEPVASDLSRREMDILQCLTDGEPNKVIAKKLAIAEATVKVHVKRILRKAKVQNRTQAAMWGLMTGIVARHAAEHQDLAEDGGKDNRDNKYSLGSK